MQNFEDLQLFVPYYKIDNNENLRYTSDAAVHQDTRATD